MTSDKITLSLSCFLSAFVVFLTGCTSVSQSCTEQKGTEQKSEIVPSGKKDVTQSFAPAFIPEKDAYDFAFSIYKSSEVKPTGVHVKYGVVFVIVNINLKKEKLKYVKGTAMLRAKRLLQQKYKLPSNFKLICRELEARNYRKQGLYRYSLAYREKDVLQLSKQETN